MSGERGGAGGRGVIGGLGDWELRVGGRRGDDGGAQEAVEMRLVVIAVKAGALAQVMGQEDGFTETGLAGEDGGA